MAVSDEQLWSWVDRDAEAELAAHLADHPEDAERVAALRAQIGQVRDLNAPAAHPEWIGPYRVTGVLGEGGMGIVYAAVQRNPHREVAVKVMRTATADSARRQRFAAECEALGRLQHPFVATVHEAGATDAGDGSEQPYLVMERVRGEPLGRWKDGRSRAERLALFADVCDGVAAAHAAHVVHRDLKPSHVLVTADGRPKLVDFGLARLLDDGSIAERTAAGTLTGTLPWMSPEQCAGSADRIGPATDVWALGVILYELLTDRLPHATAQTPLTAALRAICDDPTPPPSTHQRDVLGDDEAVVLRALEKDPANRYADASALGRDVRRLLRGEPVAARAPSWARRARWAVARRGPVPVAVSVLAVTVAVAAATIWWTRDPGPEPGSLAAYAADPDVARRAPFDRLRFSYAGPEVWLDDVGEWGALLAINDEPIARLTAAAEREFGADAWQPRFGAELLTLLAHDTPDAAADQVRVRVRPLGTIRSIDLDVATSAAKHAAIAADDDADEGGVPKLAPTQRPGQLLDDDEFAKTLPFAGLRWRTDGSVEALVDDRWWLLERVFGIPTDEFLARTGEVFGTREVRRRFGEDLVQVLTRLGYRTDATMQLTLRDLDTDRVAERPRAPLTEENRRRLIYGLLPPGSPRPRFERVSPFSAIRWDAGVPRVRVDGTWYDLVAVDGVSVDTLERDAIRVFGRNGRHRFDEDLMTVFALGADRAVGTHVTLTLRDRTRGETTTRDTTLTGAKREALLDDLQRRGLRR